MGSSVDFSGKNLKSIPESSDIPNLHTLAILNLSQNQLTDLKGIQRVSETLLELDLNYNHLKSLSDELFLLKHLKKLKVQHCELSSLNPKIEQLSSLLELDVSNNALKSLPLMPKSIELLNASFNQLESIPKGTTFRDDSDVCSRTLCWVQVIALSNTSQEQSDQHPQGNRYHNSVIS